MKSGWKRKKLGDISKINYGYTEKASFETDGPKFLRITDIQDNSVDWEKVPSCKITKNDFEKFRLNDGDIVFARTGATTGKSYLVRNPEESVFASYLIRLSVKDRSAISDFLYLFFQTKEYWDKITSGISGSAQGGFNASKLSELRIPVPPLPEQHRIVAILDEAFADIAAAKEKAEKNLKNAQEVFKRYIESVFSQGGYGWEEKQLSEIAEIKGGKRVPKGFKLLTEPTDYPYLRVSEFTDDGTIDMTQIKFINKDIYEIIKKYVIYPDDLYISIAGTIGKTGIIPEKLRGANLTENACRLILNKHAINKFVYYFTLTSDFSIQAGLNTRTAAQPKLALSRLSTIKIGIPSIKEQLRIIDNLDELREETSRLESLYQQKLSDLEELKKSVLQQAFSGAL